MNHGIYTNFFQKAVKIGIGSIILKFNSKNSQFFFLYMLNSRHFKILYVLILNIWRSKHWSFFQKLHVLNFLTNKAFMYVIAHVLWKWGEDKNNWINHGRRGGGDKICATPKRDGLNMYKVSYFKKFLSFGNGLSQYC